MKTTILSHNSFEEIIYEDPKWKDDMRLIELPQADQALVYEFAQSLAVRTLLRIFGLPFTAEERRNAPYISPTGLLPVLRSGTKLISGFDGIANFIFLKELQQANSLSENHLTDKHAYLSFVSSVLLNAEMYICWLYQPVRQKVTNLRFGANYPWPLGDCLTRMEAAKIKGRLDALGWVGQTLEQVCAKVNDCCAALSAKLNDQPYFFPHKPCELDALVFGHLFTIITTELPSVDLAAIVRQYPNLIDFCQRIEKEYFGEAKTTMP